MHNVLDIPKFIHRFFYSWQNLFFFLIATAMSVLVSIFICISKCLGTLLSEGLIPRYGIDLFIMSTSCLLEGCNDWLCITSAILTSEER